MSVFKDKTTNKWGFRVFIYCSDINRKKQITRKGFTSKQEAEKQQALFIVNHKDKNIRETKQLFITVFNDYLIFLKRKLKSTTYTVNRYALEKHILTFIRNNDIIKLTDMNPEQASKYYDYVSNIKSTTQYKNRLLNQFKRMLEFISSQYDIDYKKEIRILPNFVNQMIEPKRQRNIYTVEQYKHFIKYAKNSADKLLLDMLFYTGIRISELRGLKWADINIALSQISIKRGITSKLGNNTFKEITPKTSASIREIYIPKALTEDLRKEHERIKQLQGYKNDNYIFGVNKPIGETTIRRIIKYTAEQSNLPYITPHEFRHSYITNMVLMGADLKALQQQVGHVSVETTLNIYTQITEKTQKRLITKTLDKLCGG